MSNSLINKLRLLKRRYQAFSFFKSDFAQISEAEINNSRNKRVFDIINDYHVIEKGMTMPERRLGFGRDALLRLIGHLKEYYALYGMDDEQVRVAFGVVKEYDDLHQKAHTALSVDLQTAIDDLLSVCPELIYDAQKEMTKTQFFKDNTMPFPRFAASRHSVRNFMGGGILSVNNLKLALKLAQTAPSACNRQSVRVKLVNNKELITRLFEVQKGNRGFGHLADRLIIITSDMNAWDIRTSKGGYVDGGIYAMNLLYALHYYKIAACPLNSYFAPEQDKRIREIINIPKSESIVLFIAVGEAREEFKLANSHRNELDYVLTEYD